MMETLENVWKTELEILGEIDRLCELHGIRYFADSGTLLGAVRHGGFIPWDDDIDLAMLRRDYDRFRKIAEKELDGRFFCQSGYNDRGFYGGMLHIRMNGTTAILKRNLPHAAFHQGIFVDIFPLDGVIRSRPLAALQSFCKRALNVIMWRKNCACEKAVLWKRALLFLPVRLPQKVLFALFEWVCAWRRAEKSDFLDTVSYFGTGGKRRASCYAVTQRLPFCGTHIPVPGEYGEILRAVYGDDYMTPTRSPTDHGEVFFDTRHSYKDYLDGALGDSGEFLSWRNQ